MLWRDRTTDRSKLNLGKFSHSVEQLFVIKLGGRACQSGPVYNLRVANGSFQWSSPIKQSYHPPTMLKHSKGRSHLFPTMPEIHWTTTNFSHSVVFETLPEDLNTVAQVICSSNILTKLKHSEIVHSTLPLSTLCVTHCLGLPYCKVDNLLLRKIFNRKWPQEMPIIVTNHPLRLNKTDRISAISSVGIEMVFSSTSRSGQSDELEWARGIQILNP